MKTSKAFALKLFAVVLSILLVFGAFPVSALDATEYVETETVTEETQPAETTENNELPTEANPTGEKEIGAVGSDVDSLVETAGDEPEDSQNPEETPTEAPTEPPMTLSDGYYLIGPESGESDEEGWTAASIRPSQKFTENPADSDEMMLYTTLEKDRKIKVVKVQDGAIPAVDDEGKDASGEFVWYPNGEGNEYTVEESLAGEVVIFFRTTPKQEWTKGGGYFDIAKELEVKKDGGGTIKVPVVKDETAPELTLEGYSKKVDGEFKNFADYDKTWVAGTEKIYARLTAKDDDAGFGINDNSFMVKDSKGKYKNGNAEKNDGKYYVRLTGSAPVTITVKDNAGNFDSTKSAVTTEQLLIDSAAPTADDIVAVTFAKNDEKSFLNILSFGLYSKDNGVNVTVTVKANGGSPIKSIELKDGNNVIAPLANDPVEENDPSYGKVYSMTFNLEDKETAYDLKITDIVDQVDQKLDKSVDVLNCPLYTAQKSAIASIYEIASVSKNILPSIEAGDGTITPTPVDDVYCITEDGDPLGLTVTVQEAVSGLNEASFKAYFAVASKLVADESGTYDFTKEGVTKLDLSTIETDSTFGNAELSGKLLSRSFPISISKELTQETNTYRLVVTAESNAGRSSVKAFDFNVDNAAPVIENHKVVYVDGNDTKELGESEWTNKETRVQLTITDDGGTKFGKGVAKVEVTGTATGKLADDAVRTVTDEENTYSFTVERHEGFTVVAYDCYGHASDPLVIAPEEIRFDKDVPEIGDVLYNGKSYEEAEWLQENFTVSFNVTDLSGDEKIKGTWLSGKADTQVQVVGNTDKQTYECTRSDFDEETGYTFSFTSNTYQTYDIVATDKAGNPSVKKTTEPAKIDKNVPYYTSFEFKPAENPLLKILTFGLYSSDDMIVTVNTADLAPSSGIADITASYEGAPLDKNGDLTASGECVEAEETATGSKSFIIPLKNDEAYDPAKLSFTVKDASGRENTKTLYELETDTDVTGNTFPAKGSYEIVVNNEKPYVDTIKLSPAPDYEDGEKRWYKGDVNVEASATVTSAPQENGYGISHLHSVDVNYNDTPVTEKANGAGQYTYYGEDTTNNKKLDTVDVSLNIKDVDTSLVNKASTGKTENTVTILAESNNGKNNTENPTSGTFYIDDVAPQITGFEFDTDGAINAVGDVTDGVLKTEYGYFFQNQTLVHVYVTDTVNDVDGSGVKSVTYYGTSVNDQFGSRNIDETTVTADAFKTSSDGKLYIEFTVNAGFKGNIFASAEDNVGNPGHVYAADGTIVENEDQHAQASNAEIKLNTTPVSKDNKGQPLFNGDVSVTMTVQDLYSGIDKIEYSVTDYNGNKTTYSTSIGATFTEISGEGWDVVQEDQNLATKLTKNIVITKEAYNCNDIVIELSAVDKAGFPIKAEKQTFSIDVTPPKIQITYEPLLSAANNVGENYYFNTDRTATITVTERNFDPAVFDIRKMVALEGTMPSLNPDVDWNTTYATFTDETTHTAKIYFNADGKYQIDCDYSDQATNAGVKDYQVETFYIDKTKPTMTVELRSEANAVNGSYYNKTVTAYITVVEHNFSADAPYFEYSGSATGADNRTSASLPQVTGWTTDGDTHRATVTFSADGMYSFKISYKDLANNAGEDFSQSTFYVDQTIIAPVITGVESQHAYSGEVIPVIDYEDNNFDYENGYSYVLVKHWFDLDKMEQSQENAKYAASEDRKLSGTGLVVTYQNFDRSELTEGVYELKAHMKDLAANEIDSNTVVFSVNRFGSVFILGSAQTTSLIDKGYTADSPDVAIREINVNSTKSQTVSLSHDSATKQLTENTDYTISRSGGATTWYETLYVINERNFEDNGEYTVTVTSVDTFDNKVTNLTANTESDHERNCPVTFIVDKENPEVQISGVDENGFYSEAEKTLHIVCIDENIDKESLSVKLDDQPYEIPAEYADMELVGEIDINLPIAAKNGETKHKIEVEVKDMANNAGDDKIDAFTLSATFLTMFFHNTVALIVSGVVLAGLVALAIALIVKKRKSAK